MSEALTQEALIGLARLCVASRRELRASPGAHPDGLVPTRVHLPVLQRPAAQYLPTDASTPSTPSTPATARRDTAATVLDLWEDPFLGLGGRTWPSATLLARALAECDAVHGVADTDSADSVDRRGGTAARVVELGCGTAVAGLTAWLNGASEVVLSDRTVLGPLAEANIRRVVAHAAQSGRSGGLSFVGYADWAEPLPEGLRGAAFDLALGADLTYGTGSEHILGILDQLLARPHGRALLAHPCRGPPVGAGAGMERRLDEPGLSFLRACREGGWQGRLSCLGEGRGQDVPLGADQTPAPVTTVLLLDLTRAVLPGEGS